MSIGNFRLFEIFRTNKEMRTGRRPHDRALQRISIPLYENRSARCSMRSGFSLSGFVYQVLFFATAIRVL